MTSYALLAEMLAKQGLKATSPTKARELSEREFRGQPLTEQEAEVFAAWVKISWCPETRQVKKPGDEK